jgi:CheY-like chemotaxis protein/anti-sigma regulatory factor (Ser/Thr protein kinase)
MDLIPVLEQAIETSRPAIEAGGHRLVTSFPDSPVWLQGDPIRLVQVIANLLNNAAKYTDHGGFIALTATREGDEASIRVEDNGVGLSPEILPRVFDLFSQEDRSLDRSQGGLGIGLTLVKSLVHLHGGTVIAESQGANQGSVFTLRLPVLSTPLAVNRPETASRPTVTPNRRLRVLIVDDSQDSARSLARVLKLWGHETRVAHDGQTALDSIVSESFDVIFLDIGLPGMNGYQVGELIRERHGMAGPLIVALTGYGQEEDLSRSRSAGFDDHLVKPVNLDRVKELLVDRMVLDSSKTVGA